jgi:hypothetical protein
MSRSFPADNMRQLSGPKKLRCSKVRVASRAPRKDWVLTRPGPEADLPFDSSVVSFRRTTGPRLRRRAWVCKRQPDAEGTFLFVLFILCASSHRLSTNSVMQEGAVSGGNGQSTTLTQGAVGDERTG